MDAVGRAGRRCGGHGAAPPDPDSGRVCLRRLRGYQLQADRSIRLEHALAAGINLLDVTIDSEKDAMGRLLSDQTLENPICIQTRPEGMCYGYDPANRKMADYRLLHAEVTRITKLLRRKAVDIFNFAFMSDALDDDPDYLRKTADNISRLKDEGLIRYASADTFSGEAVYLKQIRTGAFDSIFINYNIAEPHMRDQVIPAAREAGMAVLGREMFMKAQLFAMAEQAGVADRSAVARMALKWALAEGQLTAVMVGVADIAQLENALSVVGDLELSSQEQDMLERIRSTDLYREGLGKRQSRFRPDPG